MLKIILTALALSLSTGAAQAADPPVTVELIDGWQQPDGTSVGAVRLSLAPGWKTYWRAPGDAGIPPQFSWTGSRNLKGVAISWPTPSVLTQNGMSSVGYTGQVILPLSIATKRPGAPIDINLRMDIGLCRDICLPKSLLVTGTLSATGNTPVPIIAAALAERPYTAAEAGAKGTTCALSPTSDGLKLTATLNLPHTGGEEFVVIEAGRPDVWVSQALSRRSGDTLTAEVEMMANGTGPLALDRSAIRFTVLGGSHAVDLRGCVPG